MSDSLAELERRAAAWHRRKYPQGVNLERTALKLAEEVGEVARAVLKGDHTNLREECADVAIVLLHLCRAIGADLGDEMERKLAVCQARLEGKRDG